MVIRDITLTGKQSAAVEFTRRDHSSYNRFLENTDKGKSTCAVFLDLSKAFDTVDHKILLRKLMYYGISGKKNSVFESYLTNRMQYTKINNYSSNFQTIECSVPQGSVMGPLLFLIYVNDLPCASSFQTTLFADDTSLHLSHKDIKTLQLNVQNELDKVDTWMRSNRLSINYNKTAYYTILLQHVLKTVTLKFI